MHTQKVNTTTELTTHIASCNAGISYIPYNDEPDTSVCPFIPKTLFFEYIPQNPHIPPATYIKKFIKRYSETGALCIFVPGQAFDGTGTRHGRGYGWYDRFLSQVPHHWLRIGMAPINRFHAEKIFRAPHDQPVDFVITFNPAKKEWDTHTTHARIP